jgi:hypothetical protein
MSREMRLLALIGGLVLSDESLELGLVSATGEDGRVATEIGGLENEVFGLSGNRAAPTTSRFKDIGSIAENSADCIIKWGFVESSRVVV